MTRGLPNVAAHSMNRVSHENTPPRFPLAPPFLQRKKNLRHHRNRHADRLDCGRAQMARTRSFPDAPFTQYLARSISALYAILGGLAMVVSTALQRYAPIIRFFAYVTLVFGVLNLAARQFL